MTFLCQKVFLSLICLSCGRTSAALLQAQLASSLIAVMKCSGGEGQEFANWLAQLPELAKNATAQGLSQISNSLQVFCDLMKDHTSESMPWRLSLLGRGLSSLFEKAQDVVGVCGQIVNGLQRLL